MLTNTELDFIRQNYQTLGGTDCARKLNRSRNTINITAKAMGLSLTHEHRSNIMKRKLYKPFDKRNVNPSSFIISEQMKKVNAYLLGFIWADGHISFCRSACEISARFVTDDAPDIIPLFQQTGKWGIYKQHPEGCREATIIKTNNRPLAEFLNSMDYVTKSNAPATKILSFIPTHLRRYWWLGCLDGDGCFSVGIGKQGQEIGIHSSYDQDWTHFKELTEELDMCYYFERRKRTNGTSSAVRIVKKESCAKFIHYLYPNGYEFGLRRKFAKAMEMLQRCESTHIICPHCGGDIYLKSSDNVVCSHCNKEVVINNFVKSRIK